MGLKKRTAVPRWMVVIAAKANAVVKLFIQS